MVCPAIITGEDFLTGVIGHIDCQAQAIGSYGYLALGEPGSLASNLVAGLLTLFIALFGIRLLFGPPPGARDLVMDVLKIGIVLTLAFSWPAFRTVVYDVTLKGHAEIASAIQAGTSGSASAGLPDRLQAADNAMTELTALGMGRNTGQLLDQDTAGATFQGTALQDENALGTARLLYLANIIGSLGLLRIGAGVLLALTPIVAGLYFFTQSRGIFAGWLKALVFTIGGSIAATIVLSVQLAVIEPWIADALRVRTLGYATPSAPTELFAIMLGFLLLQFAMLWLMAKVAFYRGWISLPDISSFDRNITQTGTTPASSALVVDPQIRHADRISKSVESSLRREQSYQSERLLQSTQTTNTQTTSSTAPASVPTRLGSSYRRSTIRPSRASQMRDRSR